MFNVFNIMNMRVLIIIGLLFVILKTSQSQSTINKTYDCNGIKKISLKFKFADEIILHQSGSNNLIIKAFVTIDSGRLDHEFKLVKTLTSENLYVKSDYASVFKQKKNELNMMVRIEAYIPANSLLELNSISGNIEFSDIDNQMKIKTISGFIDAAFTQNQSYKLTISSISGSIYTDEYYQNNSNFNVEKKIVGHKITGKLNNGDKQLELQTISGDIFLRRK